MITQQEIKQRIEAEKKTLEYLKQHDWPFIYKTLIAVILFVLLYTGIIIYMDFIMHRDIQTPPAVKI